MQLVYFFHSLQETSTKGGGLSLLNYLRPSVVSSSFADLSGKPLTSPGALYEVFNTYAGYNAIRMVVKYYMCKRLNRISTWFRTFAGSSSPTMYDVNLHSEVLEIYRCVHSLLSRLHTFILRIRLFSEDPDVRQETEELLFISITRFHAVSLVRAIRK